MSYEGPTTIDKLYVKLVQVRAHTVGAREEAAWVQVLNSSATIDILASKDATIDLGRSLVASGKYDIVRLRVTNVTAIIDGVPLRPSWPRTDLMANATFTVNFAQDTRLTLILKVDMARLKLDRQFQPSISIQGAR